jgi:hypothetical protein
LSFKNIIVIAVMLAMVGLYVFVMDDWLKATCLGYFLIVPWCLGPSLGSLLE